MSAERLAREIVERSGGSVPMSEALADAWQITLDAWEQIENPQVESDVVAG